MIAKPTLNKSGLTIIELMSAMTLSLILLMTVGMLVYGFFLTWNRANKAVELQRDATIAIDMIERAIRPATYAQVQVPTGQSLTIGKKHFELSGSSLLYDPDTSLSGNEIVLIRNKVLSISFTKNSPLPSISIQVTLQDESGSMTINSTITPRL